MFVLQRVQNGTSHFTGFEFRSDLIADVRSNYGLTESEFQEFCWQNGLFERPEIFICCFEGDVPEPEGFQLLARKAVETQRARKAAK